MFGLVLVIVRVDIFFSEKKVIVIMDMIFLLL